MAQIRTFNPQTGSYVWKDESEVTSGYFRGDGLYHMGSPTADPAARRRPGGQTLPSGVVVPTGYTLPDPNMLPWEANPISAMNTGSVNDVIVLEGRSIRSLNKAIPAINMANFQGILRLRHCNLFGFGAPGILGIIASTSNMRLDLEDCTLWSDNPHSAGGYPGRVVQANNWKSFRMVHCTLVGTSGVYLNNWAGSEGQSDPTVEVWGNDVYDLDGRCSDPSDPTGWRRGNIPGYGQNDYVPVQLVQFNTGIGIPRVAIHDNSVYNRANKSRAEDLFSGFLASGTASSLMDIYRNLFSSAWTFDAWFDEANSSSFGNNMPVGTQDNGRVTDTRGYQNSGGGGLLGDGKGSTYLQDPGFQKFRLNTVLNMANYGLGVSAGHDMLIESNTILRSPYVRGLSRDVRIAWRNVAIQIQDYGTREVIPDGKGGTMYRPYRAAEFAQGFADPYDDGAGGTHSRWYNIDVKDNLYGSTSIGGDGTVYNDGLLVNSPLRTNSGNQQKFDITRADEDAAEAAHRQLWANLGIKIGRTG